MRWSGAITLTYVETLLELETRVTHAHLCLLDTCSQCKVEWFHFECVGLTAPPKGKWMCAECTAALKDRKKGTHS